MSEVIKAQMLLLASEWLTTERKKQKKGEKKMSIRKWFLLMSAGFVLASCGTETEAPEETGTDDGVEEAGDVAEEVSATVEIEIDGETLSDLTQEVTVPVGTTVMDALNENYDVVAEEGFVSSIEGNEQDADAGRYWMFYVNDEMPSVGAAEYEIEEGDFIEWRLEDSEF